jgi:hypothetical protein
MGFPLPMGFPHVFFANAGAIFCIFEMGSWLYGIDYCG